MYTRNDDDDDRGCRWYKKRTIDCFFSLSLYISYIENYKKKFVSINFFSTIKNILDLDSHFFLYQMNEWTHMKNDDDDDNKD